MAGLSYEYTEDPKEVNINELLDPENPFNASLEIEDIIVEKIDGKLKLNLDLPDVGTYMTLNGDHGNFKTKALLNEVESAEASDNFTFNNKLKRIIISYTNKHGNFTEDAITISENTKLTYKNGKLIYKDSLTGYSTQDYFSQKIEEFDEAKKSSLLDNFPEDFEASNAVLTLETFTVEDAKELHQVLEEEAIENDAGSERANVSLRLIDVQGNELLPKMNQSLGRSFGSYTLLDSFKTVSEGVTYTTKFTFSPKMSIKVRGPKPRWFQKHHYLQPWRYSIDTTLGLDFGISGGVKTTKDTVGSKYSYSGNLGEKSRTLYKKNPFFLSANLGADAGFTLDLNTNSDSNICNISIAGVSVCGKPRNRDLTFSVKYEPSVTISGSSRGIRTKLNGNKLKFNPPKRDDITGTALTSRLTPYLGLSADVTHKLPFFGTKNVLSFGPRIEIPADFKIIDGSDTEFGLNMELVGQATILKFLRGGTSFRTPTLTLAEIV